MVSDIPPMNPTSNFFNFHVLENYQPPILVYNHTIGKSIVGGYVYRGCQNPNMQGFYFYADTVSGWDDVCFAFNLAFAPLKMSYSNLMQIEEYTGGKAIKNYKALDMFFLISFHKNLVWDYLIHLRNTEELC